MKPQNETHAIGYVAARLIECVFIAAGIMFVLGVVTLRHDSPDAVGATVALAALKDSSFPWPPDSSSPFGNGLILGYLMYRSGLVPRGMSVLVTPEFLREVFLGIYCPSGVQEE